MMHNELEFHAFCLTDTGSRLDRFAAAIAARVRPGDSVLDLGAGSGILSFLACRAGARRVYAIEAGGSIEFARLLAERHGFQDRIQFISQPSTQVRLPARVETIVGDIHDTFGLQRHGLGALMDARDRFLAPGGTLIPCRIQLMAAPIEAPDHYQRTIDVWRQRVQGIDLSPLRSLAVHQPTAARIDPSQLLSPPVALTTIDLMRVTRPHVSGMSQSDVTRDGTLHGVCGCFVTTLADDVVMGNVPGDSETTNFAQAFFPIESPLAIRTGDRVTIRLETHDGAATRWQVDVTRDGSSIGRFDHSMLHAEILSMQALRKQADDYRPSLTPLGAMERDLLDRFDGTHSAADLESWLTTRAESVLPSAREAAAFLKQTIERCG
jgi:PRMT5 arginine-N-methyltransferase/ribosomal protein L11 methyltransferase PrmA